MLNSAYLLLGSGADPNMLNEARKRPVDLCTDNAPLVALLSNAKPRSIEEQGDVVVAAKDLLDSTIVPATAQEHNIILLCQKVVDDYRLLERPPLNNYQRVKESIAEFDRVNDEFKDVVFKVQNYRGLLNSNVSSISTMGNTLDGNQKDMEAKLNKRRGENSLQRSSVVGVDDKIMGLSREMESIDKECEKLELRLAELRERKVEIAKEISEWKDYIHQCKLWDENVAQNETVYAERSEDLYGTIQMIDNGVEQLKDLDAITAERLMRTGLEYAKFLKFYFLFIKDLEANFSSRIQKMDERIEQQQENIEEIPKLELKLDDNKIRVLIDDYASNMDMFNKRMSKIFVKHNSILSDYSDLEKLISSLGRQLDPIEDGKSVN